MSSLKRIFWRLTGLSSAVGAVALYGRIVILLTFGLIAILALTGTFGSQRCQQAAQVVLAILLGRTVPWEARTRQSKLVSRPGTQRSRRSSPPKLRR
jgi:hypothetical protein